MSGNGHTELGQNKASGELAKLRHLPGCTQRSLAETYPNEPKPPELSEASWTEVKFAHCAPGCPVMARDLERGRELAEEHGW